MIDIYLKDTDWPSLSYNDAYQKMSKAQRWAELNCKSLRGSGIQEMSDMDSAACDWMGWYQFEDEKDAIMFKLKWS